MEEKTKIAMGVERGEACKPVGEAGTTAALLTPGPANVRGGACGAARRRRWSRRVAIAVAAGVVILFAAATALQRRLYYWPHRYENPDRSGLPAELIQLEYRTGEGEQVSFYVAPLADPARPPERLWIICMGNGSLVLEWLGIVNRPPDPRDGMLLIEYPGFGWCEGRPSRRSVTEGAEAAFGALAKRIGVKAADLERRIGVVGVSMGAAVGLEFAARHPVERIVLVAPFTSLVDAARSHAGWPICQLVFDRFDNRARLAELARRDAPPRVTVIHGDADRLLPVEMGRELARLYPGSVYHEIRGAGHNTIQYVTVDRIVEAMRGGN